MKKTSIMKKIKVENFFFWSEIYRKKDDRDYVSPSSHYQMKVQRKTRFAQY